MLLSTGFRLKSDPQQLGREVLWHSGLAGVAALEIVICGGLSVAAAGPHLGSRVLQACIQLQSAAKLFGRAPLLPSAAAPAPVLI